MTTLSCHATLSTAHTSGAVAIVQIVGADALRALQGLTQREDWPLGRTVLCDFGDIDRGLATLLRDDWAQVMPHGGPLVVRHILDALANLGVAYADEPGASALFPEAESDLEADMLLTISQAASPCAIDLLLAQPKLWQKIGEKSISDQVKTELIDNARKLDRLIQPPSVVVVGAPNVGKSTLANWMVGRTASIVADLPGTTRDWVANMVELNGVAVRWYDTPGIRDSGDPIEQHAIELARQVIQSADVLIAMRDPEVDWPELSGIDREADIRLVNKADLLRNLSSADDVIRVSAQSGQGLDKLTDAILEALNLASLPIDVPWAFSDRLKQLVNAMDHRTLDAYSKKRA